MTKFRLLALLLTGSLATVFGSWTTPAWAVPASPHPLALQQPDGTPITLYIRGDEHFFWYEDAQRFTVVASNGAYFYAALDARGQLVPTNLMVGQADPAQIGLKPRTLPASELRQDPFLAHVPNDGPAALQSALPPAIGTFKNIVIILRFLDHVPRTLPSNADIGVLFNNVGPHALAPTGSIRDAYLENSYGLLTLNSTVFGWVTLPETEAYYADGDAGRTSKVWEAIQDALNLADPLINFNQFDDDGNGFVDSIAFIHSGYGAEWGGTDCFGANFLDRIWSHRWSIPTWTSAEGEKVSAYHISPGVWATCGSDIGHIGVITHETGHFFGLPDLYDVDGSSSGNGSWCMMANSWGFDGSQYHPPHFSAWCKVELGWVIPTDITTQGLYVAPQVETNRVIFRLNFNYGVGEYLLIENRQPVGLENILPGGGGLMIWHIDDTKGGNSEEGFPGQAGWPGNNKHYQTALLQADGQFGLEHGSSGGDAGDAYRAGGVTALTPFTTPNTDRYQGGMVAATGNAIAGVSASSSVMTFSYTRPNFDCNHNGFEDADDISSASSLNCNGNALPDECEMHEDSTAPGGPFYCTSNCAPDCNASGVPDQCELGTNDCNSDGRPDECGVVSSCEVQKVTAGDSNAGSRLGSSVGVFGALMVVGDDRHDTLGIDAGAAYAYQRSGLNWAAYGPTLTGSDTGAGDEFGSAAAMFGGVAVVGARSHTHGGFGGAGAAYAFADTGTGWAQYQKVLPLDPGPADSFGAAISMDGDVMAVGAPGESGKGAVYVFRRTGGLNWVQEAKITAFDGVVGDEFGEFVSLRNDVLVTSARGRDEQGSDSGSAYVHVFDGSVWQWAQKINPSNGFTGARFGRCAGLYPLIVCGAPLADVSGADSGTAYVFRYSLAQQAYQEEVILSPTGATAGQHFGSAVAVGNDLVVVGAESDASGGPVSGGAIYVFRFASPFWGQFLSLTAADAVGGDYFGAHLYPLLVNDRVWVTAPADPGSRFGAVYEYALGGSDCNCNAAGDSCDLVDGAPDGNGNGVPDACENLDCNENGVNDAIDLTGGTSPDCDGNGRPDECDIAVSSTAPGGPFYCTANCDADCDHSGVPDNCELATRDCNLDGLHDACGIAVACNDQESQRMGASDPSASDNFGASVSINGAAMIVGANWDDCTAGVDCGSAYVFRQNGSSWAQEQKLTASDAAATDSFGRAVGISGDKAVVGSFGDDCTAGLDCGAAYVYQRQSGTWSQQQKLTVGDAVASDTLGLPVAIDGDYIAAGAVGVDCLAGNNCGAVYMFRFNGVAWAQDVKLSATDVSADDGFGQALAIQGDLMVVGSAGDDCLAGTDCGAAYVFRRSGGAWSQEKKLTAFDAAAGDGFGAGVAVSGDVIAVGAPRDDCVAGADCGAVYTFRFVGGTWLSEQKVTAVNLVSNDQFGRSIGLDGGLLVASAYQHDCPGAANCGYLYTFRHNGASWSQTQELKASDGALNDNLGGAIAVSGTTAVGGATFDDCLAGGNCGSVYRFNLQDADCNCNSVADRCDIAAGTVPDVNGNGVPDPCEVSAPTLPPPPHDMRKNRYVSFSPNSGASTVAFRVQKLPIPANPIGPYPLGSPGGSCWVQTPGQSGPEQFIAQCAANPVFRVWSEPVVHVGDCEVIPVADYEIYTNLPGPVENPAALAVGTILQPTSNSKYWGDVAAGFTGTWPGPDGFTNVNDLLAVLAYIGNTATKPHMTRVNLSDSSSGSACLPSQLNVGDVQTMVAAIATRRYSAPDFPLRTDDPAACGVCPTP